MRLFLALLLTLQFGAPFGEADAKAVSVDGNFVVEVTVEAPPGPDAVLARIVDAGRQLPPVALAPLGDGRYGGFLTLSEVRDVRVAFEARIGVDVVVTDLVTLTDLGVDPVVFGDLDVTAGADPGTDSTRPSNVPLLVGVILAIGSLVAFAVWAQSVDKRTGNTDNTENVDRSTSHRPDIL